MKTNRWYDAIVKALMIASPNALTTDQIWTAIEDSGFKHKSKFPRATLDGRIAELCKMKAIERVADKTYRWCSPQMRD
jgi:hypothetical protein